MIQEQTEKPNEPFDYKTVKYANRLICAIDVVVRLNVSPESSFYSLLSSSFRIIGSEGAAKKRS